jgi:hypothetical protein
MLAVRHGVSVPCLKRLNNIMTDHSLASRSTLWIPGELVFEWGGGCVARELLGWQSWRA